MHIPWRAGASDLHSNRGRVPAPRWRKTLSVQHDLAAVAADAPATGDNSIGAAALDALPAAEKFETILGLVRSELDGNKAEDIVEIDLTGKSDIADLMIVASGRSQRHVGAIADKIQRRLKEEGMGRVKVEGLPACDWVLIDAEDVIVHLFRPEVREFYKLERIWSEAAHASDAP